ncbi:hypothetical protein D9611_002846 [Ephemerocybe angulata]|uniref:Secreted protein n=1 Tax=Ephemerocybe angulata TaxID=980116 RepID=A0A8H5FEG5_9AGAR|nr:hypothetical protein D9611_002846 [Tulosesus angulatus]
MFTIPSTTVATVLLFQACTAAGYEGTPLLLSTTTPDNDDDNQRRLAIDAHAIDRRSPCPSSCHLHSGTHFAIPLPTLRYKDGRSRAFSRLCVHLIARVLQLPSLQRSRPGHFFLLPLPQVRASLAFDYRQSLFHSRSPPSLHSTVLPPSIALQTAVKHSRHQAELKTARIQPGRRDPLQFGLGTHDGVEGQDARETAARRPQILQELILDCKTNPHAIGALDGWRRRRTRYHKVTAFKAATSTSS